MKVLNNKSTNIFVLSMLLQCQVLIQIFFVAALNLYEINNHPKIGTN